MSDRVVLSPGMVESICARIDTSPLSEHDRTIIKAVMRDYLLLGRAFIEKSHSVSRLLKMFFGAATEKAHAILDVPKVKKERGKPKGHGRKGASAYTGGKKARVPNTLKAGDMCPQCEKGKVYPAGSGVTVRITGNAPLDATVWEREKLRCNLCGEVFSPVLPEEAGDKKYDETAGAMISLLKYGSGLPMNRLEELQNSLGIPLPASTQWEIIEKTADRIYPAYQELIRHAAQGALLHNDDTTMRILAAAEDGERSGTFTTGVLSVTDEQKIALFFTGHKHAGENLTDLLKERYPDRGPPLQMCDALSRNMPKEFVTLLAHCLAHARRNFVDIAESFMEECRYVIEILAGVYKNDAVARGMTPALRLAYHQAKSGALMEELREWMNTQFDKRKVEPNSGLGKAFSYMLKHWEPLTLFLRVEGVPLDNNICERALKMAIRHRRNSLFYKTLHGAYIGDLFMSIIHTCRLSKVNPFDYLVTLQKHTHEVFKNPEKWLPWNYRTDTAGSSLK
jgi:transposase